jgi:ABC-2 type transport system ATP-binding protein
VLVAPSDPAALTKALHDEEIYNIEPQPDGRLAVGGVQSKRVADIALKAGVSVYGIEEERVNLEQLYFSLTNGQFGGAPIGQFGAPQVAQIPQQFQQPYQQYQPPQQQYPQQQQYQQPYQPPQQYQQPSQPYQPYQPPPPYQPPQQYQPYQPGQYQQPSPYAPPQVQDAPPPVEIQQESKAQDQGEHGGEH